MEQTKVDRLNFLFEKMIANSANVIERRELNNLYQEYINDGRDKPQQSSSYRPMNKVAVNY